MIMRYLSLRIAKGCSRNKLSMRNNGKHSKNDKVTQRLNLLKYLKAVSMKLPFFNEKNVMCQYT